MKGTPLDSKLNSYFKMDTVPPLNEITHAYLAPSIQSNFTEATSIQSDIRSDSEVSMLGVDLRITLYSIIFVLSITGNSLVILTLMQNRRMRTVTNVFLLNLAVSDLLLAVFCMPFTLIPTLMRDFIFGHFMCIMIRYIQGVSIAVSVFTLVSISLERHFAICQPLRSRTWQTLSHSYKMIAIVWFMSFVIMIPIAVFQKLVPLGTHAHKCLEQWTDPTSEKIYTLFLDTALLIMPLILMFTAYSVISVTLWKGIKQEMRDSQELLRMSRFSNSVNGKYYCNGTNSPKSIFKSSSRKSRGDKMNSTSMQLNNNKAAESSKKDQHKMRHSNTSRSLRAKKRVIRMLFVLVLEFFVCWTPMYVMQTWFVFDSQSALNRVSPITMNFIHLLSYVSSCCNPITYCFMNNKFRQGFIAIFRCCGVCKKKQFRKASMNTQGSPKSGILLSTNGDNKRFASSFKFNGQLYQTSAVNSSNEDVCYMEGKVM